MPFISLNDHKHFFLARGKGHTIIFLHGALLDHTMWEAQLEFFSRHFRVIVYDFRGHGQSKQVKSPISIELLAEDLRSMIDAFAIDKPIICGLSLGGLVAQEYAAKYPNRVKKLILADTAASLHYPKAIALTLKLLFPKLLSRWLIYLLGVRKFTSVSFKIADLLYGKSWLNPPVKAYIKNQTLSHTNFSFYQVIAATLTFRKQKLRKIKCPTLIVNGEHENKLILMQRKLFREGIKNLTEAIITESGHLPPMENPADFNKEVADFLKK